MHSQLENKQTALIAFRENLIRLFPMAVIEEILFKTVEIDAMLLTGNLFVHLYDQFSNSVVYLFTSKQKLEIKPNNEKMFKFISIMNKDLIYKANEFKFESSLQFKENYINLFTSPVAYYSKDESYQAKQKLINDHPELLISITNFYDISLILNLSPIKDTYMSSLFTCGFPVDCFMLLKQLHRAVLNMKSEEKDFLLQIASQCFDLFEIYCHNEYLPRTYRQYQLQVVITLIEIIEGAYNNKKEEIISLQLLRLFIAKLPIVFNSFQVEDNDNMFNCVVKPHCQYKEFYKKKPQ